MRGAPVMIDGERRWVEFEDIDWTDKDFLEIGREFSAAPGRVVRGKVACADTQLMFHRALVDFSVDWMTRNRSL
jgi:aminoglycoside 3-N-acetyltransferase